MATPLDVGLLQNFQIIFPFLFVFAVVFGVLSSMKIFGENKAIHALIAAILAFMTLFSSIAIGTINRMAPWFVIFFIFMIFVIIGFQLFGATQADVTQFLKASEYSRTIGWWIVAVALIIGFGSLATELSHRGGFPGPGGTTPTISEGVQVSVTEDGTVVTGPATQETRFFETLFHPKILGMGFILLVAVFTVHKLAGKD